jgi:3-hydroxyisobutyrate dehydrogenase-like beta-hydroxyacid dehydrogenase
MLDSSAMSAIPIPSLAFVGFGEAAAAFVQGWGDERPRILRAYDIKTDSMQAAVRDRKLDDYVHHRVNGCTRLADALAGVGVVFSVVTADQALVAARQAAACITPEALYFDCNSCSPGTKRQAAQAIEAAGGRYVDVAVMAPVQPARHHVPLLVSGPHAEDALAVLAALDMRAKLAAGPVGAASSIKMVRSIMIKGLEALVTECTLAGRRAGVDEAVLASLEASFPGFGWEKRAAYMLERSMTHGIRRAAEMREVALTVEELGLPADMAHATVAWQQRIGDLALAVAEDDYRRRADALSAALPGPTEPKHTGASS